MFFLCVFVFMHVQVIAIAMDVFTDVDIFKEIISAALRGVIVYIILDDSRVSSFLSMSQSVGINVLDIKVKKKKNLMELHFLFSLWQISVSVYFLTLLLFICISGDQLVLICFIN